VCPAGGGHDYAASGDYALGQAAAVAPAVGTGVGPIDAALLWPDGHAYFFKGNHCLRYSMDPTNPGAKDKPLLISQYWPGLSFTKIDAAMVGAKGKAYFFSASEYVTYSVADRPAAARALHAPRSIGKHWHKLPPGWDRDLDAALFWPPNGKAYFFKGGKYIRYDMSADHVDQGEKAILPAWPGLVFPRIDAAFADNIGTAWFFRGNQSIAYQSIQPEGALGPPETIDQKSWPGLSFASAPASQGSSPGPTTVPPSINLSPEHWFLSRIPRSPRYTEGNEVIALIDGSDYMADLAAALSTCDRGVYLAAWRVTGQQHLRPTAPKLTVIDAIRNTIPRGARVRAMIYLVTGVGWPGPLRLWHGADNRLFCEAIRTAGQEAVLDGRLSPKPLSAHHQKVVIVESSVPDRNCAYVGGMDLCFDRWDTPAHASPPDRDRDVVEFYVNNAIKLFKQMPAWLKPLIPVLPAVTSYLPSMPAWHDVQARLRGPAVHQVWSTFAARWNDPRPANAEDGLEKFRTVTPITAPLAPPTAAPGTCWVQVLQTLPCNGVFPFAPGGEQTVLAAYARAIERAKHYIYIEDQYLWPSALVNGLEAALRRNVHVVLVVSREYDLPGMAAVHEAMRGRVVGQLRAANPAFFKIFHPQQPGGGQIYVHAKTMIVDDAIAFIGSANLNDRSMTNDTELHLGIVDAAQVTIPFGGAFTTVARFAHEYRCRLWSEHLRVPAGAVVDPLATITSLWAAAPGAGGRAHPHVVKKSPLDIQHLSEVITNLYLSGLPLTALGIPGVPLSAGAPAIRAAVAAALTTAPSAVIAALEDLLNPHLVCV
jgi:phosphatidylserine/phosphatidylglycerophosphate/cardiolipin synthase-like enzyme